jgi:hypothetical protein
MQNVAQQKVATHKLQALLKWTNQITVIPNNLATSPSKRLVLLFFTLDLILDLALDPELARVLNFPLDLVRDLSRAFDLDVDLYFDLCPDTDFHLNQALGQVLVRTYTRAQALNEIINSSVHLPTLIQELKKLQLNVPYNNEPFNVLQSFAERLLQTWCRELGLDRELLNLSKNEVLALADYFYICELIVRCKEAAVRVPRDIWESIKNSIAMPNALS